MRVLFFALVLLETLAAQIPQPSVAGTARTITPDRISVQTCAGDTLFYADKETKVWRGQWGNALTVVRPGDKVLIRYRQNSGRPEIVDLYANITHVWGRIQSVTSEGFEVDQNFNADPQSAYRRQRRDIRIGPETQFEGSTRQDLRAGRTADIIGLNIKGSVVQATRVIVYEGNAPVRMPGSAPTIAADGSVHVAK